MTFSFIENPAASYFIQNKDQVNEKSGTHHLDQHDNTNTDFIKLAKKHNVKHKAVDDGTKMTGHPDNIRKVLSVMPNHDPSDFKEAKLDPVDPDELRGKHKDRKDKDIDNDGDVDKTDKYLHKRRKAISKKSSTEDEPEGDNGETATMNPKMKSNKMKSDESINFIGVGHSIDPYRSKSSPYDSYEKEKKRRDEKEKAEKERRKKATNKEGNEMVAKESRIRTALNAVLERGPGHGHMNNRDSWDEKLKGKGAKDMAADAKAGNPDIDTTRKLSLSDVEAAQKAGPKKAKARPGDSQIGDKNIVKPGTPMVDPAAPKAKALESVSSDWYSTKKSTESIVAAYKSMSEVSMNTLGNYIKKRTDDVDKASAFARFSPPKAREKAKRDLPKYKKGVKMAVDKMTGKAKVPTTEKD